MLAWQRLVRPLPILRLLWPHVLPLYDSVLEFFEQWVEWSGGGVPDRGPNAFTLAELPDRMLDFVEQECRLRGAGPGVEALLRYERLKLDARTLPITERNGPTSTIEPGTIVGRTPHSVAAEFGPDLRRLLHDVPSDDTQLVVIIKQESGDLRTVALESHTRRIWSASTDPIRVDDLLATTGGDPTRLTGAIAELVNLDLIRVFPGEAAP